MSHAFLPSATSGVVTPMDIAVPTLARLAPIDERDLFADDSMPLTLLSSLLEASASFWLKPETSSVSLP